jgi:hypothetical protein
VAAHKLLLNIFSQMRRQFFESGNILQVPQTYMGEKSEQGRHGNVRIAKEGDPDIVLARPFGMMRDGRDNPLGHTCFRKNLEHLALGKKSIVQGKLYCLGMPWPTGRCGTRETIISSATRLISAGAEGSRLRRTKSNK